jgi:uncharacterized membrane protein
VKRETSSWPARFAVIAALLLYVGLPPKLTLGPVWIAPVLVLLPLTALIFISPTGIRRAKTQRAISIGLIAILNFFNIASVVLLIDDLIFGHHGHQPVNALELLHSGSQIWGTNVLVFALWFWEIEMEGEPDFLFPQMTIANLNVRGANPEWSPHFLDFLYLSFTNALAFSPTDTMPLTRVAKMLMLVESLVSFITIALIFARSVNILG